MERTTAFPSDIRISESGSQIAFQQSRTYQLWNRLAEKVPFVTFSENIANALPNNCDKSISLKFDEESHAAFTGQIIAARKSEILIDLNFEVDFFTDTLTIFKVTGNSSGVSGNMRELFKTLTDSLTPAPITRIELDAKNIGSYAWAKFGFSPNLESWCKLQSEILEKRLPQIEQLLDAESRLTVKEVLRSFEPKLIWALADLTQEIDLPGDYPVFGNLKMPLGKALLIKTSWEGELELNDKDAMQRMNDYILKSQRKAVSTEVRQASSGLYFS